MLLFTRAYEQSANIFLISILLLLLGVLLVDPVVRAFKELRSFVLITRSVTFVGLFCGLLPVIRHFGMIGAAALAGGCPCCGAFAYRLEGGQNSWDDLS